MHIVHGTRQQRLCCVYVRKLDVDADAFATVCLPPHKEQIYMRATKVIFKTIKYLRDS